MAVAVDFVNNAGSANNTGQTFSMNLAAGATLLIIGTGERVPPSATPTWNGSSTGVTQIASASISSGEARLYALANPTTGTHNVSVTNASGWNSPGAISFTGASTTITNSNNVTGASSSTTTGTCTSTVGSIVVDYSNNNQGATLTATGTGQTRRWETHVANGCAMSTTDGAATTTVTYTQTGSNTFCMALLSVDVAAATSNIKTFDGIARASIKTIDGTAIASVKTWDGITNV